MMITGLIGNKVGMSRVINDKGFFIPVTYVYIPENIIVGFKKIDSDGYNAIIVGTNAYKKATLLDKFKDIKEFRVDSLEGYNIGDNIDMSFLKDQKEFDITGITKGKGFTGKVKRWNHKPLRASHGTKYPRHGSTMNTARASGKLKKGVHLPGRAGCETFTLKSRPVLDFDLSERVIGIKGALPGANGSVIIIKKS